MKYLVVIGNGLTDQPVAERDNHTPLQLADIPSLHRLAIEGRTGSVRTVPEGMPVSGEVSSLSLLGFDPKQQGRSRRSLCNEGKRLVAEDRDDNGDDKSLLLFCPRVELFAEFHDS